MVIFLPQKEDIMKKTVLSKKLTEIATIRQDKTLVRVNDEAGFGPNFIYRLWGRDNIQLSTVNRIANVLGCSACDILEEIEE